MRDLCDECPGRLGEVVTREEGRGVGGDEPQRDSTGDEEEEGGGFRVNCQFVRLRCSVRFEGCFCFSCF